jgi:hypothetical protein
VTCSAKLSTDGFDPFGGCPPRGFVGISAAHTDAAMLTAITAVKVAATASERR